MVRRWRSSFQPGMILNHLWLSNRENKSDLKKTYWIRAI
jgi:hypothetical protein